MDTNINLGDSELLFKDEVYQIIGAAMEVANQMGCGFLEAVYQEALEVELYERHIPTEPQKLISISYKNKILKHDYLADFICYSQIIIEIKASKRSRILR